MRFLRGLDLGVNRPHLYPARLNRPIHGLRGLAALMVFVFHVYGMSLEGGFWPARFGESLDWLDFGRHGVEVFFVLSGYLIAGTVSRRRDPGLFLIDRGIRIYPVFLAIHLLVFFFGPLTAYKWMADITSLQWLWAFLHNALLLPGIFDLPLAQLSAWSLSYEAAFYLAAAGTAAAARHFGRGAAAVALALCLGPLLFAFPKAVFFLIGAGIHFLKAGRLGAAPRWVRWLSPLAWAAMVAALTGGNDAPSAIFYACAPAFLFFWSVADGRCLFSALLRARPLQYFGTVSYSFYLWSAVAMYPLKLAFIQLPPAGLDPVLVAALFAILGFAASTAAAHLSFIFLEDRAGRYLKAWVRRDRPWKSLNIDEGGFQPLSTAI